MEAATAAILALVLAGVITVWLVARREGDRLARERALLFQEAAGLLQGVTVEERQHRYPEMAGSYRGRRFVIDPVVDALSVRKLPSLWLKVTLVEPMPVQATTDVLMRPLGTEDFTPFPQLPHVMETPEGLPLHAVVRCDSPLGVAPAEALAEAAPLLSSPKGKELLITPRGVRVVVQAAEGDRAAYILRQARFPAAPLDPGLLKDAMDTAIRVADRLQGNV